MAYTDFTLQTVEKELGIVYNPGTVFADLQPILVPTWLTETLDRGLRMRFALVSEKARSEYIVAPILMAVREQTAEAISIVSGQRLDVDVSRKLTGECDFILARSEAVPVLRAPIMTIVEAKKQDIEAGLGQCIAQMVAAKLFNENEQKPVLAIFGCVTTGEDWQFLQLVGTTVTMHNPRLYLNNVGLLLAAFAAAIQSA
jgi:hypothetical protein